MLAKITSKNQLTLPKAVLAQCFPAEYYDVEAEDDRINLTPVQVTRMDAVWNKLEALGITEHDIADAVKWARSKESTPEPQAA
jgi:hypothetical protein